MTECSRCGDCCEEIYIRLSPQQINEMQKSGKWASGHDLDERDWLDINWIRDHFTLLEGFDSTYECDAFDSVNRLCTAHEDRPPLCRRYPWYGKEPSLEKSQGMSPRCSFNADIRTMLPIVEVRNGG